MDACSNLLEVKLECEARRLSSQDPLVGIIDEDDDDDDLCAFSDSTLEDVCNDNSACGAERSAYLSCYYQELCGVGCPDPIEPKPEPCAGDRVLTDCGTPCQPTCAEPYPLCDDVCVEDACQCPEGTVLIDPLKDECVAIEECPDKECKGKGDRVWTDCGTACPPTCAEPYPECIDVCVADCQCPEGTVLIDELKDECVTVEECPATPCKGDRVWTDCGTSCQPTCDEPNPECVDVCVEDACQCPEGTVLIDPLKDECVAVEECPDEERCKGDRVWTDCGTACQPTCAEPNPECDKRCVVDACQCPKGTVLIDPLKDHCVALEECPEKKPTCPGDLVHTDCGTACPRTCEDPNPVCPPVCVKECQCPKGQLLAGENECVESLETCDEAAGEAEPDTEAAPTPAADKPSPSPTRKSDSDAATSQQP